jgi:hypothetical protein
MQQVDRHSLRRRPNPELSGRSYLSSGIVQGDSLMVQMT